MTNLKVRSAIVLSLTIAATHNPGKAEAQSAITPEEFARIHSTVTFDLIAEHTFVARRGMVRETRWDRLTPPQNAELPGFSTTGKTFLAEVAGETANSRTLFIATSENLLYQTTVTGGQPTPAPQLIGGYNWMGGRIQSLSGFLYNGVAHAVVLMTTGDVWWITPSAAQRIVQTYAPDIGGPRFISAVVPTNGRPDIFIGPYFFGGIYRIRDILGSKLFDFVAHPGSTNTLAGLDAQLGLFRPRVVFADTLGNVSLVTYDSADRNFTVENNVLHLDGTVNGLNAFSPVANDTIYVHAFNAEGTISAFARSEVQPYFDVVRFDTYDLATGLNDSRCVPGGPDSVTFTSFGSRTTINNSPSTVYLPYPENVRLEYALIWGGAPTSLTMNVDGVEFQQNVNGFLSTTHASRIATIDNDGELQQVASVTGPCGRVRLRTTMRTIAPTAPSIQRFSMEPRSLFQFWTVNIVRGEDVVFTYAATADAKCDPRVIVTGRPDRSPSQVVFSRVSPTLSASFSTYPDEDTDYQMVVECQGTGLRATAQTVLNVNVIYGSPGGAQTFSELMTRYGIITSGWVPFYSELEQINGRLTGLYNPNPFDTLLLVRFNRTTADCGNPSAVIALGPQSRTTDMHALFGTASPPLQYLRVVACLVTPPNSPPPSTNYSPYITYEYEVF